MSEVVAAVIQVVEADHANDGDSDVMDIPSLLDTPEPYDMIKILGEKTAHLSSERAEQINKLVMEHSAVIADKPGCAKEFPYTIKLKPDAKPTYTPPYRMSPRDQDRLRKEIDGLISDGLIEPSESDWCSPAIIVPKPGGAVRCCIDYRKNNLNLVSEHFPIGRIDDLIEKIGHAKYKTKLDLSKGFYQMPLDEKSKPITSFSTPFGQFQWTCLPFGLKTSPSRFCLMMSKILAGLEHICAVYIDDIVIFSDSWEDHLFHIATVLKRLRSAGLTVKLTKCFFACPELEYLGHMVGIGKVSPGVLKVKALLDSPRPLCKRQVMSLVGLAAYYKRYLLHFSHITAPLTDLLKKGRAFKWTEECEASFLQIKQQLASSPTLLIADFNKPFFLYVDASAKAVGSALMQEDELGEHRPVAYYSKKLAGAQVNYSVPDKECLGLVLACRAFKMYLRNGRVVVYTDHQPLVFMNRMATSNQRLLRWSLELQAYDLEIKHISGKKKCIS